MTNPEERSEERSDSVDESKQLMEIFNSGMLKGENTTYDPKRSMKYS